MPEKNLKVLIDTGATDSTINPNKIKQFKNNLFLEKNHITGLHRTVYSDKNLNLKLFEELGINKNIRIRVIPWHNIFDILIGSQDLLKLQANINYKDKILQLGEVNIPFYFEYNDNQINIKNVNSNVIHVPTSIEDGEIYIPEQKFEDFIISECFLIHVRVKLKVPFIILQKLK